MADVLSPHQSQSVHTADRETKSHQHNKPRLPPMSLPMPIPAGRNGQISLDVFSPVNQNGSFEFDRVLKSGHISKRSRKTKQWRKFYLVLRPNLLSMYRNESEEKLLKQVNLSDLTAVTILKDPKGRRDHMFGLFTPSHNYQFQADSDAEARSWVDLIKKEARIDEEEESMIFGSPPVADSAFQRLNQSRESNLERDRIMDRLVSSSPEPTEPLAQTTSKPILPDSQPILYPRPSTSQPRNQSFNEYDYSGQEQGSYSDFSDAAPQSLPRTFPLRPITDTTLLHQNALGTSLSTAQPPPALAAATLQPQLSSQPASQPESNQDEQRVLWQGYLLCLKSKGGVRQWKKLWTVLRPAHLAFYKNEEEYSTHLLLPLASILSAIEIDPLSRSKAHCLQIIAEDRNYRFCAESEDQLARCLGAIKSLLARRKGVVTTGGP